MEAISINKLNNSNWSLWKFQGKRKGLSADNQTVNNLTARLLIEEERMVKDDESSVVLMAVQFKARFADQHPKKCYACGKAGHLKFQCRSIECSYCKKKRHMVKDCFAKKKK